MKPMPEPIIADLETGSAISAIYIYDRTKRKCFKSNNFDELKPTWVLVKPTDVSWVGEPYYAWRDVK